MSRLIDADKLEEMTFNKCENVKGMLYVPYYEVMRNIREIPTAYDIENVVAELEHEAKLQKLFEEEFYARHNIEQAHVHRYAEQCYRNKAIEIVKRGVIRD